jgi:hypothetical protein
MAIVHLDHLMVEQLPSRLAMHSAPVNGTTAVSMLISHHHEPAAKESIQKRE